MFNYPIQECDVTDKLALEEFRSKKIEWGDHLNGKDIHAIMNQFWSLMWNDTWFRVFNEILKWNSRNNAKQKMNPGMTALIQTGYLMSQTTRIRRLVEPQQPNKVISIKTLLDDIKAHRHLITREIYVSHDNLPYDYQKFAGAAFKTHQGGAWDTTGPLAFASAEIAHEQFDSLSNVSPEKRTRYDRIADSYFTNCENLLGHCYDIKKYTNKFIAHAAHPDNRKGLPDKQQNVSMNKFEQCHKGLYSLANKLTQCISGPSFGGLPTPQYDHLKDLETTLTSKAGVNFAREHWMKRYNEIGSW